MSRICEHCGKEISEDSKVCEYCGTFQMSEEEKENRGLLRVKFTPVKILFVLTAIVALFFLFLGIRYLNREIYQAGGYKRSLDALTDVYNGKIGSIKKLAPKEYWNHVNDTMGFDIDEYIEEAEAEKKKAEQEEKAAQKKKQDQQDTLDDDTDLGTDTDEETEKLLPIKYSYKILEYERFDKDELKRLNKEVKELCDADDKKLVTDAYYVRVRLIKEDGEDESSVDFDAISLRVREGWFLYKDGSFFVRPGEEEIVVMPEFPVPETDDKP